MKKTILLMAINTIIKSWAAKILTGCYTTNLDMNGGLIKLPTETGHTCGYRKEYVFLEMQLPIDIVTKDGLKRMMIDKNGITITSSSYPQVDPTVFYFKKVILE